MNKEEVTEEAFKIIAFSGDAFDQYYKAAEKFKENKIDDAITCKKNGDDFLNQAHAVQTKLIQKEINKEDIPYLLIMTHAQDHFSKANNWQSIISLLVQ